MPKKAKMVRTEMSKGEKVWKSSISMPPDHKKKVDSFLRAQGAILDIQITHSRLVLILEELALYDPIVQKKLVEKLKG